jgi:hypothetical protein
MRKSWSIEENDLIISRFASEGSRFLSLELGRSRNSIDSQARRLGVKSLEKNQLRAGTVSGRNVVNHRLFDSWSADMAYVLGYIFTDGSVQAGYGHWTLKLECNTEDEDILLQVRGLLNSNHKVSRKPANSRKGINSSPKTRCSVCSHHLVKKLELYGIVPGKSMKKMIFPDVPDEFLGHLSRGVSDGDGCNSQGVAFLGQFEFLEELQVRLCAKLSIPQLKIHPHDSVFMIVWKSRKDVKALYHYMYPVGNYPYGERKKLALERLL